MSLLYGCLLLPRRGRSCAMSVGSQPPLPKQRRKSSSSVASQAGMSTGPRSYVWKKAVISGHEVGELEVSGIQCVGKAVWTSGWKLLLLVLAHRCQSWLVQKPLKVLGRDPRFRKDDVIQPTTEQILALPWLSRYTSQSSDQPATRVVRKSSPTQKTTIIDADDDTLNAAHIALLAERHAFEESVGTSDSPFSNSLRGGKWTFQQKGVVCDAVAAQANNKDIEQWCSRHSLNKMASFSSQRYGQQVATILARTWVSKMSFLYASQSSSNSSSGWQEPSEFSELASQSEQADKRAFFRESSRFALCLCAPGDFFGGSNLDARILLC